MKKAALTDFELASKHTLRVVAALSWGALLSSACGSGRVQPVTAVVMVPEETVQEVAVEQPDPPFEGLVPNEAEFIQQVLAALDGEWALVEELYAAPLACAENQSFQRRMEHALDSAPRKIERCRRMGLPQATLLDIQRYPREEPGPVDECSAYSVQGHLRVRFTVANGDIYFIYLKSVATSTTNDKTYLLASPWCRQYRDPPAELLHRVEAHVDQYCACEDAACLEALRESPTNPVRELMTGGLRGRYEMDLATSTLDRSYACRERILGESVDSRLDEGRLL